MTEVIERLPVVGSFFDGCTADARYIGIVFFWETSLGQVWCVYDRTASGFYPRPKGARYADTYSAKEVRRLDSFLRVPVQKVAYGGMKDDRGRKVEEFHTWQIP